MGSKKDIKPLQPLIAGYDEGEDPVWFSSVQDNLTMISVLQEDGSLES